MKRRHDWQTFADCLAANGPAHAEDIARWADYAARHATWLPAGFANAVLGALESVVAATIDRAVDADEQAAWTGVGDWNDER